MSNNNNNNPKHGQSPHAGQHGQHKQGQPAAAQPEVKKNGWCASHKGPKAKCNCE